MIQVQTQDKRQQNVQSVDKYKWTFICKTRIIITYSMYYHVTYDKQYKLCITKINNK